MALSYILIESTCPSPSSCCWVLRKSLASAAGLPRLPPPAPTCSVPFPRSLVHSLEGVAGSTHFMYPGFSGSTGVLKSKALAICVRQSSAAAAPGAKGGQGRRSVSHRH